MGFVQSSYPDSRIFSELQGYETGSATQLLFHEAGHGIEGGDANLYKMMMEASILDADAGTAFGPRRYGETQFAEMFATFLEELSVDASALRTSRPNMSKLFDAVFTDGATTSPSFFSDMARRGAGSHPAPFASAFPSALMVPLLTAVSNREHSGTR